MSRKIIYTFLLLLCALFAGRLRAQVVLNLTPPSPLMAKPSDLFNALLVNAGPNTARLYFTGTIVNTGTGRQAVKARTPAHDYEPGSVQLSESFLAPVYAFTESSIEQSGLLPYGRFQYCLTAYSELTNEEVASRCADVEITPMSPPLLLSPADRSVISVPYPLLTWLPPTPVNPGMNVVYDLKLVELAPNQTPFDAVHRNFALLDQHQVRNTTLQYPVNAMPIEEGKTYAWNIIAKTGTGSFIGETETWIFTYRVPQPGNAQPGSDAFVKLQKELDGSYASLMDKRLYFEYTERYTDTTLNYKIFNAAGEPLPAECSTQLVQKVGENRYVLDLHGCSAIRRNQFYLLEVYNRKHEVYKLKFK